MKYRKKPVIIDAFHYSQEYLNGQGVVPTPKWIVDAFELGVLYYDKPTYRLSQITEIPLLYELYIKTLEGNMKVSINDYIIKGVQDEIYPCKPDIFKATYELVEEK